MPDHFFVLSEDNLNIIIKRDHFPYLTQSFDINIHTIKLFSINVGVFNEKKIELDIGGDIITGEINYDKQIELSIAADADVLTRDKDAQVFLVLGYNLE